MKNNKNDIIKFFVWMRNGIAFCTTWLLIIWIAYCHISNQQQISVSMLTKLLFFVIGGVLIFNILFTKASPVPNGLSEGDCEVAYLGDVMADSGLSNGNAQIVLAEILPTAA